MDVSVIDLLKYDINSFPNDKRDAYQNTTIIKYNIKYGINSFPNDKRDAYQNTTIIKHNILTF